MDRRHFEAWTRERRTVACADDCSSLVVASDACRTLPRAPSPAREWVRAEKSMSPPRGHASPCLVFGVLALMTGAAALAGRLARERRELPRRDARFVRLRSSATRRRTTFTSSRPARAGPPHVLALERRARGDTRRGGEGVRGSRRDVRRRRAQARRRLDVRARGVLPIAPAREWATWAATLPEASSEFSFVS